MKIPKDIKRAVLNDMEEDSNLIKVTANWTDKDGNEHEEILTRRDLLKRKVYRNVVLFIIGTPMIIFTFDLCKSYFQTVGSMMVAFAAAFYFIVTFVKELIIDEYIG